MLAPVIERAVDAHPGKVELAKLDTDANQATAARYGIRGLPTVKAFRNGEVVDEFTGAQPPAVVERFVDKLVPSEADELAVGGDEAVAAQGARGRPRPRDRAPRASAHAAAPGRQRRGDASCSRA